MFGCYISESRIAVSLIFVSGLKDCRVKRRCAVPMPVLQPCAERVQPAIIVHGESMSGSIIVVKEVTVCVEKPLDFQNFLQLGKRPPVLIVTARITPVLLRKEVGIINEPFVPMDVGCRIHRTLPADLAEMERESCGQRKHVVAQTVRTAITIEVLERGRVGEFQHGTNSS